MPPTLSDIEVLKWFKHQSPLTPNGTARLAASLLKSGKKSHATKLIQNIWINGNFGAKQEAQFYRQFRRWTLAGIWDLILEALNEAEGSLHSVQMIDSTVIRAHHLAAGAKGGLKDRVLAVQKVASRPKSTSLPTLTASLSGRK